MLIFVRLNHFWSNYFRDLTRPMGPPKWWWIVREMGPRLFQGNLGWWNLILARSLEASPTHLNFEISPYQLINPSKIKWDGIPRDSVKSKLQSSYDRYSGSVQWVLLEIFLIVYLFCLLLVETIQGRWSKLTRFSTTVMGPHSVVNEIHPNLDLFLLLFLFVLLNVFNHHYRTIGSMYGKNDIG